MASRWRDSGCHLPGSVEHSDGCDLGFDLRLGEEDGPSTANGMSLPLSVCPGQSTSSPNTTINALLGEAAYGCEGTSLHAAASEPTRLGRRDTADLPPVDDPVSRPRLGCPFDDV